LKRVNLTKGQGLVEYALILILIALVIIVVLTLFGTVLEETYTSIISSL